MVGALRTKHRSWGDLGGLLYVRAHRKHHTIHKNLVVAPALGGALD